MPLFSPLDTTLWYATATPAARTEVLADRIKANVCIVGGGYSGLTTALELAKSGVDVVALDTATIGEASKNIRRHFTFHR
ncbi:FAD dependent oxidoreductase [Rhizobium sp. PP-F2F-G38]|nr:FAD dependent oxidoreductase [Rhizobium sp. PP-WC-1G-195]PYE94940.1 FAD dependent oxidoreductase [Rhizobium sp. PP-F2F-G38]TCP82131.1 FAD dependent oxidoreductase [Rhizobium sp. PP-CC-2G-626]